MTQFKSGIKQIPFSATSVYSKISDLNSLEAVKESMPDKVQELQFSADSVSFTVSPLGKVSIEIIDRTPNSCVTFGSVQSPLAFNLAVQLAAVSESSCQMQLSINAELNPFIKGMVQKPLEEGLEKLATMLAAIPY